MTQAVLGIDTSCYTTSCALVSKDGEVLAEARKALDVPPGERGLRQSEAVFQQVRQLPDVLRQVMEKHTKIKLLAVCASQKPLDEPVSYMPVFTVGASMAEAIALGQNIPCYMTTHQRGHFAAARIGLKALPIKYLALHLSGGTTQIILCENDRMTPMGATADISAGQLLDRSGVLLGFPFPAGPLMEKAAQGHTAAGRYPARIKSGKISFSGCEAAAKRDALARDIPQGQIAVELFDQIARSILKLSLYAVKQTGVPDILVTGGVASSALLRGMLAERISRRKGPIIPHFGLPAYSSDNAAGVAMIGLQHFLNTKEAEHGSRIKRERTLPGIDTGTEAARGRIETAGDLPGPGSGAGG